MHLDLEVASQDRGRVIGRQGRTADALRTLLETVARRRGIECDMEVVD
ncbi:MAG TPA: KH domain-containing protein [Vicinamibacteria bacterium]|nr:KH domain-containing protein [Vicinamibacteria bacterium]